MNKILKLFLNTILSVLLIIFFLYLILPSPEFPQPPSDSIQSIEGGDIETPLRRAYFTLFTRQEILTHYQNEFSKSSFLGIPLITYRLNYPPEEAQTLIRDQTRSTFLEEIVHPLRESFFVNGFKPSMAKDDIWYKGVNYQQKITVKYVPGNLIIRLITAGFILLSIVLLIKEYSKFLKEFIEYVKKN